MKDWDTKSIEMLHKCDAGEYSVLTVYGPEYFPPGHFDSDKFWDSERMMIDTKVSAMLLARFFTDGYPAY